MPNLSQEQRRFTVKNHAFTCDYCRKAVPPSSKTCRNHCPFCLSSKHVDILPGDRANNCLGQLRAIDYDLTGKKGLVLIQRCDRCSQIVRNKAALDEQEAPDDYDLILTLKPGQ